MMAVVGRSLPVLFLALFVTACASIESTASPGESPTPLPTPTGQSSPRATRTLTSPSECPGPPFTLDEVAAVPVADRPACFGSQDLTLVGWVFEELNPRYDCITYLDQPTWLYCIMERQPLLAAQQPPSEWDPSLRPLWVASDPEGPVGPIRMGAADGPVPINTWVEVTGHFDDPAATACPDGWRVECAGTLVLTAARPAEAPP